MTAEREDNSAKQQKTEFQQEPLEVQLGTHPALDVVIRRIEMTPLDWKTLIDRFEQSEQFRTGNYDVAFLDGILLEHHLDSVLEHAAQTNPNIALNPIINGEETANYRFSRGRWGLQNITATDKLTRKNVAEYDHLLSIRTDQQTDFPIVMESTRLTNPNHLKSDISVKAMNRLFKPLKERFIAAPIFAYVVATVPEVISTKSPYQEAFTNFGGKIIPFGFTGQEFSMYMLQARYKYDH